VKHVHGWFFSLLLRVGFHSLSSVFLGVALLSIGSAYGVTPKKAPQKRLIVKMKQSSYALTFGSSETKVKKLDKFKIVTLDNENVQEAMANYQGLSDVEYVEEDRILQKLEVPNDPLFTSQWHYDDQVSGIHLSEAFDLTAGSSPVVVAVVDTGVMPHPDLSAKLLPGMDMVSNATMGNDGDGRDQDATDPGDWISPSDFCYQGRTQPSSWHGTHVAGTIAASTNNGVGVAGINPSARILPVRVLGKCGGYTSDIIDGMKWAAGISVAGVANNPNPAKVINLSLGSPGSCSQAMQEAINEIRSKGVVIVVAAGNSATNVNDTPFTPANCQGVVTVSAINSSGDLASYSNYGARVDVAAPGGESWQGVLSTSNSGSTIPYAYSYKGMAGTSMASPHVAGVASLMFSVNLKLVPSQVIDIIKSTASSYPASSSCRSLDCGDGIVNAYEAVRVAKETLTDGAIDAYHPSPVSGGGGGEQSFTVMKKGGGACGSIDLGKNVFRNFTLNILLGACFVLIPFGLSRKKHA